MSTHNLQGDKPKSRPQNEKATTATLGQGKTQSQHHTLSHTTTPPLGQHPITRETRIC